MELTIIARFHAKDGADEAVAAAMRQMLPPVRAEAGCLGIEVFRSTRDVRTFFIHSRWRDEASFDLHATLPHTVRFIQRVEQFIDHPLDITRARHLE